MTITPGDPNQLRALGEVAESLTRAYTVAANGNAPYAVMAGLKSTLDRVRLSIEEWTRGPSFTTTDSISAVNRMNGWVPYAEAMDDPHWPLCFERRAGMARRKANACDLPVKERSV
jgi:hypothetical protein